MGELSGSSVLKPRKPPDFSGKKFTRRGLLEWLGKGCVLALGGSTMASCLADLGPQHPQGDGGLGQPDGGWEYDDSGEEGFAFNPGAGNHPVFSNWGERTVDRQDLQEILQSWRLGVEGMVESPRVYTFADLVELPRTDMLVDFHCVEGWSIYDVPWNGLHLSKIFEQVKPTANATHVTFHTIGGKYNESLPLDVALESKTMLAYGIGGNTLPLKHGFPLRIVIPRLLAYKNAKYVERLELTDRPLGGFWVAAGYPYDGEVPDSRLRPGKY
jgi:DMSO/TMAO reductase YedYZ molybdopterin-dependent catalytic subunit